MPGGRKGVLAQVRGGKGSAERVQEKEKGPRGFKGYREGVRHTWLCRIIPFFWSLRADTSMMTFTMRSLNLNAVHTLPEARQSDVQPPKTSLDCCPPE